MHDIAAVSTTAPTSSTASLFRPTSQRRVAYLIAEMASSGTERAHAIGQIGDALNLLGQVTQQKLALVEQSAAAAGSLKQPTQQLIQAVAPFRLHA